MAPWASLTWITYNPFSSSSPALTGSIIPENGIQLSITFCGDERQPRFHYNASETVWPMEGIAKKMTNLEELKIWYLNYNEGNFNFCLPLVKGLQTCQKLKKLSLDYWMIPDCAAQYRRQGNPNFRFS